MVDMRQHLDKRRSLMPRDYFDRPEMFGLDDMRASLPQGGDNISRAVADLQHRLVLEWRRRDRAISAAELCQAFGFSKQVLSRVTLGQRWAGETVFVALHYAASGMRAARATTAQR